MLPWYSVFDNLSYRVDGDHVTLMGQVTRPTLKSDAEAAVKHIEGVQGVDNQIQVLPNSPDDDQIREALSGNLCRCTGYQGILKAVHAAAELTLKART